MNNYFWLRIHGGAVHFPIALLIAAFVFDSVAWIVNREPHSRDLHAAGFYSVILGGLASFVAVFSGLLITQFDPIGHGALAKHHLFVWPAFAMLVGMGIWRVVMRTRASRKAFGAYLGISAVAAAVMAAAGYFGGEMVLGNGDTIPAILPAEAPGPSSLQNVSVVSLQLTGRQMFVASCARCHGDQGAGLMGPDLQNTDLTYTQVIATISDGVPPQMPSFGTRYRRPQIQQIAAYVKTLK